VAFGWPEPGLAFDVALHVGSLVALLWYFRAEWIASCAPRWSIAVSRIIETAEQRRCDPVIIADDSGRAGRIAPREKAETAFRASRLSLRR